MLHGRGEGKGEGPNSRANGGTPGPQWKMLVLVPNDSTEASLHFAGFLIILFPACGSN